MALGVDGISTHQTLWKGSVMAVIGEAINRLSPELRERHPDVPQLRKQISEVLNAEFPETDDL